SAESAPDAVVWPGTRSQVVPSPGPVAAPGFSGHLRDRMVRRTRGTHGRTRHLRPRDRASPTGLARHGAVSGALPWPSRPWVVVHHERGARVPATCWTSESGRLPAGVAGARVAFLRPSAATGWWALGCVCLAGPALRALPWRRAPRSRRRSGAVRQPGRHLLRAPRRGRRSG